jgi:hypothetical protein
VGLGGKMYIYVNRESGNIEILDDLKEAELRAEEAINEVDLYPKTVLIASVVAYNDTSGRDPLGRRISEMKIIPGERNKAALEGVWDEVEKLITELKKQRKEVEALLDCLVEEEPTITEEVVNEHS